MLRSENRKLRNEVLLAAQEALPGRRLQVDFEHGQWWVTDVDKGGQWSVVDAVGGSSVDGFDFERVTEDEMD